MQIEKTYIKKQEEEFNQTYFRLRFFSSSKQRYIGGDGFKLTFGLSPHLFFYRKEWKEIKLIILGLRNDSIIILFFVPLTTPSVENTPRSGAFVIGCSRASSFMSKLYLTSVERGSGVTLPDDVSLARFESSA